MTIYYILIIFVGLISFFTINMKNKYKRNKIIIILCSTMIIIIQWLRKITVGVDLSGYIPALSLAKDMNFLGGDKLFNYELGYSLYSQFFVRLGVSNQIYLLIVAITIMIPISYTIIKNSKMPGTSIYIYITLGFFTFTFSGIRQSIALAITFFSFKYIKERKFLKFIICIILAILFHKSAIVFTFAYPLYNVKIKSKDFFIIIPMFILVFIFKSQVFSLLYKFYRGFDGEVEGTNAYTMLIVMIFILILSYMFGRNIKENLKFNAYKNYMIITIFIQVFASQSNVAMRAGYYYYIFVILLIPEVIRSQKDLKTRVFATSILIITLIFFFQLTTGNGYLNVSPYYFYWE